MLLKLHINRNEKLHTRSAKLYFKMWKPYTMCYTRIRKILPHNDVVRGNILQSPHQHCTLQVRLFWEKLKGTQTFISYINAVVAYAWIHQYPIPCVHGLSCPDIREPGRILATWLIDVNKVQATHPAPRTPT